MKPAIFRSIVFNLFFYALTAVACVLCLPTLVLPRRYFMGVVHLFVHMTHFLERVILGLRYEVRGLENLPKEGPYIIAAKHQSAYETTKLHILFKDPSVILKKELLSIPLWGLYLKKSDPIAIDRSTPDTATQSIKDGALRMKEQGRPIVIFPQGTRVGTDQTTKDKPYKPGVARIQEATDLPIIPMALNTGLFWPRNSFFKSPGCVIFEFLKPIKPGLERQELMAQLEKETEEASLSLMNEEKEKAMDKGPVRPLLASLVLFIALLFGIYSFVWFAVADQIKEQYPLALQDLSDAQTQPQVPEVSGYPGKIQIHVAEELIQSNEGSVRVKDLHAESWPIPALPITVTTGPIEVKNFKWDQPLQFESLHSVLKVKGDVLTIRESALIEDDFRASVVGTADLEQEPIPAFDLNIRLKNHAGFLRRLAAKGIIEDRIALFMSAGLTSLADETGEVEVPLTQKGNTLYAGPLPVMTITPKAFEPRQAVTPEPNPSDAPASDLGTP